MELLGYLVARNSTHIIGMLIYGLVAIMLSVGGCWILWLLRPFGRGQGGPTENENRILGIMMAGLILGLNAIVVVRVAVRPTSEEQVNHQSCGGCAEESHKTEVEKKLPAATP